MSATASPARELRHFIYTHFHGRGHPPDLAAMAAHLGVSAGQARALLAALGEEHAVVLARDGESIEVAHPFSRLPTPFWVENRHGAWWGNCAWDSLAIAALTPDDATTITTRSGADGAPLTLTVQGDEVSDPSLVVHFAVPASRWWADVRLTCATILLFRSAEEIPAWSERHGIARGEVVPVATVWELSKPWYGDRLDRDWRRKRPDEAQAILDRAGLRGAFWDLSRGWR